MDDFNDILKKSLSVVNEGFRAAMDDIENIIAAVRESIKGNAGNEFSLECSEVFSNIKGSIYRVFLDTDSFDPEADLVVLTYFRIPQKGYPIELGNYNKVTGFSVSGKLWTSKDDVMNHFVSQLQDPESQLIQAIGFALRRRMK